MPIKILHLVLSMDTGGLENGVVNIINGLDETKFTSVLCCIKHGGDLISRINKDIKVIELNHYSGIEYQPLKELKRVISEESIDIVHTRNHKPFLFGFIAAKILSRTALVHSEHGKDYPFNIIKMFIQKMCTYFTNEVVALTRDIKSNMVRHVGIRSEKIQVIINGVDTVKFSPSVKKPELIREFGIMEGDIVVGAVGRMVAVKNYPELLLSARDVISVCPNIKFIIIGDGPELETIKGLTHHYGLTENVYLPGNRDDIDDVLRLLDVYVLTSTNEGLSNTLLEAMSTSLPVVVSRVGGNTEIVNSDLVGYTYLSGDNDELTNKILKLYKNKELRENIAASARNHVIENYSLDNMINNYSNLYENVYKNCSK